MRVKPDFEGMWEDLEVERPSVDAWSQLFYLLNTLAILES